MCPKFRVRELSRAGLAEDFLVVINPDHTSPASYKLGRQIAHPTAQIEDDLALEWRQGIEDSGPVSKPELPLIVV
jgi:hypothetical protein